MVADHARTNLIRDADSGDRENNSGVAYGKFFRFLVEVGGTPLLDLEGRETPSIG